MTFLVLRIGEIKNEYILKERETVRKVKYRDLEFMKMTFSGLKESGIYYMVSSVLKEQHYEEKHISFTLYF